MLKLINKDRARAGLKPVKLDRIATEVGQKHAEECSEHLYLAHWDLLGRKPWERYTELGGKASAAENVAYTGLYMDGVPAPNLLPSLPNQMFNPKNLEEMESSMVNEKPPHDGHRVNILDPHHTSVGLGISVAADGQFSRVTLDQEFLNDYGTFDDLPLKLNPTKPICVGGTLKNGYQLSSIDLEWEPTPQPMTPAQLNTTSSYGWPENTVMTCWPPPYVSPVPVQVTPFGESETFNVAIPPLSRPSPGVYYVIIWARSKKNKDDQFVASVRTLSLGPRATLLAMAHPKPKFDSAKENAKESAKEGEPKGGKPKASMPSSLPDMTKLYFHPELAGSRVIPATAGEGGLRPDLSKFFAKPTLPPGVESPEKQESDHPDHPDHPDNRKLFFHPGAPP